MQCDRGYFCRVCGTYVDELTHSDLYLRYVMGEVTVEQLFYEPEAHIWCNGSLAQFIVDPEFDAPFTVPAEAEKSRLAPAEREAREKWVTRAWRRLQSLPGSGLSIPDYPLDHAHPT